MIRTYLKHSPKIHPTAFVHDSAEVIGAVLLGEKVSIWPLCVLRGDTDRIRIGPRSNVQDLTVIHTRKGRPSILGREVVVGHGVIIHGARIGDRCLIGMGAIVMEATIGTGSIVAAGSLVPSGMRVPPGSVVMGSPARVVRKAGPRDRKAIRTGMVDYLRYTKEHRETSRVR